uniref:Putative lambda recombination protein n=1 Tax=viral metagenome TaxID=1070528 RepID=A0A6M3Y7A7_9ZZZZ
MKKSPIKRKSKSPYAKAKAKAWKVFSIYIRERDGHKCFTCGGQGTQAGHFVHSSQETYFDEQNVHAQCSACNLWKHGNLGVYAVKLDAKYGTGTAESLIKRGKGIKPMGPKDFLEIYEKYKT